MTVAAFGGSVLDGDRLAALPISQRRYAIQIDDDLYLLTERPPESGDYINHSCAPSCGLVGSVLVVAMRPIDAGEEITIDYAMCDSSDYDNFDCACGAASCRGRITGGDWRLPELQSRYAGWFSSYLERKIGADAPAQA